MTVTSFLARCLPALALLPLIGCGSGTVPPENVPTVAAKAIAEGRPQVAWDLMPPKYHADVNNVVHEFAGKMDPEVWSAGVGLLTKTSEVLKTKKDFILNNSFVKSMPAPQKEGLEKNWNEAIAVVDALLASELKSVEDLKKFDGGHFLATTGTTVIQKGHAVALASGGPEYEQQIKNLAGTKGTLIKTEGDTAIVKVETPEKTEEVTFKKVDGKWLPAEMVDEWAAKIAEAKKSIAEMPPITPENKAQFLGVIKSLEGPLDKMLAAKTQEEFDSQAGALMFPLLMMGSSLGRPAFPPVGGQPVSPDLPEAKDGAAPPELPVPEVPELPKE